MKLGKVIVVLLILAMLVSIFATGCSQTAEAGATTAATTTAAATTVASTAAAKTTATTATAATTVAATTQPATNGIVTAPGVFPVVNEPYTLRIFTAQPANVEDLETNDFTVMYEEKSGVHVEWELVPSSDVGNMKQLSLSSGDYPDVYAVGMSKADEMKYAGKVLVPLKSLIDQYSVWFKEEMDNVSMVRDMVTSFDGDIYCYPVTTYAESHLLTKNRFWINTYWLNQLNLTAPTTLDEFYSVLQAFKNDDPNGNGKADEIPLILTSPYTSAYFMCAFLYDDGENRLQILDDGTVVPVFNKDEFREGLRFLNKLYSEGLTDSTAFTLDSAATKELFEQADAETVGGVSGLYQGSFANIDGERQAHMDALPPLKGPQGVQLCGYYPYVHATGVTSCTVALKNPEVFVRWIDWMYSFEGGLTVRTGPEGVYWQVPPEGSVSYAGLPAKWERLTSFGVTQNVCWSGLVGHSHSMHGYLLGKPDQFYEAAGLEDRLIKYTKDYLPFATIKTVLPSLYVSQDVATEYYKIQSDINKYVNESFAAFVTGTMNLDSDWDAYCKQLDTIGLAQYIETTQTAYNSYLATH